jgi:hypothetical protein
LHYKKKVTYISWLKVVIGYNNKLRTSASNTKYLGIVIENSLPLRAHIDQLIPKLCTAFYAIRAVKPLMSLDSLKVIFLLSLSYEMWNNILGKFFT